MGNDSGFGRRNAAGRQPPSPVPSRQRGTGSTGQGEHAAAEIPVKTETSQAQVLLYVGTGVAILFGGMAAGFGGLSALSGPTAQYTAAQPSKSNAGSPPPVHTASESEEAPDVADAGTVEPTRERNTGTAAGNSRQHTAAMKFLGYYHLNTRARASYCGKLGVDMSPFNAKFRQTQIANHKRATTIIAKAGLTEDQVYEKSRSELESAIREQQEQIAQQMRMPPNMSCAVMVKQADKVIAGIDFAKIMPDEHAALTGS